MSETSPALHVAAVPRTTNAPADSVDDLVRPALEPPALRVYSGHCRRHHWQCEDSRSRSTHPSHRFDVPDTRWLLSIPRRATKCSSLASELHLRPALPTRKECGVSWFSRCRLRRGVRLARLNWLKSSNP